MFSMGQAAGQDEEGTLNRTAETGMGMLKVMSSARPALVRACKTAQCALGRDRDSGAFGQGSFHLWCATTRGTSVMVCICRETREGDAVPTTWGMHDVGAASGSERQGKSAEQFVNSAPKDKQRVFVCLVKGQPPGRTQQARLGKQLQHGSWAAAEERNMRSQANLSHTPNRCLRYACLPRGDGLGGQARPHPS